MDVRGQRRIGLFALAIVVLLAASCGGESTNTNTTNANRNQPANSNTRLSPANTNAVRTTNSNTSAPPEAPTAEIEEAVKGYLAVGVPRRMVVDEASRVEARIARKQSAELLRNFESGEPVVKENLEITDVMSVELVASPSTDFQIKPESKPDQAISTRDDGGFGVWTWSVVPLQPGAKKLRFDVYATVSVPGSGAVAKHVFIDSESIDVTVTMGHRIAKFIGNSWQWLATTIVIPLVVAAAAYFRRRSTRRRPRKPGRPR